MNRNNGTRRSKTLRAQCRKAKCLTGDRKKEENPISSLNESQLRDKREFFNNKQPISVGV